MTYYLVSGIHPLRRWKRKVYIESASAIEALGHAERAIVEGWRHVRITEARQS